MSGMLFGERVVEIVGTATFEDTTNGLRGELQFDANNGFLKKSQGDDIKGHIYSSKVHSQISQASYNVSLIGWVCISDVQQASNLEGSGLLAFSPAV